MKRRDVWQFNAHMVKNHLMTGAGISDNKRLFKVIHNKYADEEIYNYVYEKSVRNKDSIDDKELASLKILLNAFREKLRSALLINS